jgi:hypothetical protein
VTKGRLNVGRLCKTVEGRGRDVSDIWSWELVGGDELDVARDRLTDRLTWARAVTETEVQVDGVEAAVGSGDMYHRLNQSTVGL